MIKKIEIHNYRSCYSTSIEFDRTVCALIGKNGVGKTNILRCIQWLSSAVVAPEQLWAHFAPGLAIPDEKTSFRVHLTIGQRDFDYVVEVPNLRYGAGVPGSGLAETLTSEGENGESTVLFHRYGEEITIFGRTDPVRANRWTPSIGALCSLLPSGDPILSDLGEIAALLKKVHYYPLDDPTGQDDIVSDDMYQDWLIQFESDGTLTRSSSYRLIFMLENDKDLFDEFQTLIGPKGLDVLTQLQISTGTSPLLGTQPESIPIGSATQYYFPRFQPSAGMGGYNSNGWFEFSDLSAGTQRVIQIVVSLLFDKRSVMLIEQPEDSIHPGLLRKLIDLFRSYSDRSQIIFATHSSQVLDMLRPEEVLMVTAAEGRTEARKLSAAEVSQANRFLKNEGSLSEFLEPCIES